MAPYSRATWPPPSLLSVGHSWSTSNRVQGASPLEPQLCTPLQQAEHKGKPTRTSATSQTRGFIVSYCEPVLGVFACGPESFLMLLLQASSA